MAERVNSPLKKYPANEESSVEKFGVGFIIGVVQDSVETALNSSCDLLLSAAAQFREWRKEGREITY